eukprot:SAG25_NODE_3636_length_1015_cov_3.690305_1_plen_71_part_10
MPLTRETVVVGTPVVVVTRRALRTAWEGHAAVLGEWDRAAAALSEKRGRVAAMENTWDGTVFVQFPDNLLE